MAKRQQTTGQPRRRMQAAQPEIESQGWFDRLLGNPRTRQEREDAINRLLQRGMLALGLLVALVIGVALLIDQVIIPNQSVATVNGQAITVSDFRDRVRFERARIAQEIDSFVVQLQSFGFTDEQINQQFQQEPYRTLLNELNFPDQLGRRVLDDMVEDTLIAQEAERRNITVSDELIETEVNEFFGFNPTQVALIGVEPTVTPTPTITPTPFVSPTPSPTPTETPQPSATPEEEPTEAPTDEAAADATPDGEATADPEAESSPFPTLEPTNTPLPEEQRATRVAQFEDNQQAFETYIRQQAQLGAGAIDAFFRRQALREAVAEAVVGEQTTATYVNARHILVETEEQAQDIKAALDAGASFADLARASSTDQGSGANGGELDWGPASQYVDEFRDAVLSLPIGEISDPVESQFGFHIIQVRAREERELTETEQEQQAQRLFTEWVEQERDAQEENIDIAGNWPDYVPR